MAGEREQIELQGFDVDGNFSDGLDGVGVEVDVGFGGDFPDISKRLDGAKLVVGVHHADENGFGAKGMAEFVEVDEAFAVDGEIGDRDALRFEGLAGIEDGFVLDGGGDYVRGG